MNMDNKLKKYERILKENTVIYTCVKEMNIDKNDAATAAAAYVFCPAAAGFSLWLIKEAMKRNIKRLYFLSRDGYFFYRWGSALCRKHRIDIECKYLSCSRFSLNAPLKNHSKEKLNSAAEYFRQEGLFDGVSFGIVDSGWTGRVQASLKKILEICGNENNFHGFYWGLYTLPDNSLKEYYHSFYFRRGKDVLKKTYFNNNVFETVFSAPHGMTEGYYKLGKAYLPVYLNEENTKKEFILKIKKIFDGFFEKFSERSLEELMNIDLNCLKKTLEKLFKAFMVMPSEEESLAFGKVPFSHDAAGEEKSPLALYFSKKDFKSISIIKKILRKTGLIKMKFKESGWLQGTAVLYAATPRKIIFKYTLSEFLRHFKNSYLIKGKG